MFRMGLSEFLNKGIEKMNRKSLTIIFATLTMALTLTSCQNSEWSFPDYEYKSVYFSYQYPVRTIILGESSFNNELDNNHQFEIMATTAGVYENKNDVIVEFEVDESLVDGFLFDDINGDQIQPMPDDYYKFMSDQMVIPKGKLAGGVKVQLTDAFFNDSGSLKKTYVLPLQITSVINADTVLSGEPKDIIDNPRRGVGSDWEVLPKDFTFYAVKYINQWDGFYLRRGKDVITRTNGETETIVRRNKHVVDDQVVELNTHSLTETEFPVVYTDSVGNNLPVILILTIDDEGKITVSDNSADYTVSGSGTFVHKDESEESWGEQSRNAIYLNYEVSWESVQRHVTTTDTLVLRNRGIGIETFTPVLP